MRSPKPPERADALQHAFLGARFVLLVTLGLGHWIGMSGCWQLASAAEISPDVISLTTRHCVDCHDGESGEGGFDANSLADDLSDPTSFQRWVRVFDRVRQGEMPPPDVDTIKATAKVSFLKSTEQQLLRHQLEVQRREGRVRARRLTNVQLQRSLQDLLCIDIPLARLMPPETRTNGFVNLADYQVMSHFQLEAHLKVVDAALDAAFDRALSTREDWNLDIGPDRIANKPKGKRNRDPELREGAAVVWSGGPIYNGRISNARIPHDGWYEIEIIASAVKKPKNHGVWCSLRSGECVSSAPLMNWIGAFEVDESPRAWTFEGYISQGHLLEIQPADVTLPRGRFAGGQVGLGEGESQGIPGLALHHLRITQLHPGGTTAAVCERLFGELARAIEPGTGESIQEYLESLSPSEAPEFISTKMLKFAEKAFRRPTDADEIARFIELAKASYEDDGALLRALRIGYRAILCSPRFLYFVEPAADAGKLDAWALASRLSYFICGSTPDEALLEAAADGTLNSQEVVQQQTDRLLETSRGKQFIANFSSQWLDLIDIDFTEPDRKLYRDFDLVVQASMLAETHRFLQHLLNQNLPIGQLVNANHTFLNSRLARYYNIDGVTGDEMQLVELDRGSERGGILAHGAIHKVTANGNDTSPVLRGIWVSERLLGVEIPSPPTNVPAVEPDVRGATTIRELLTKHQADDSCASCHRQIDPPGFALESFDAAGRWRDRYRQLVGGKYKPAAKIDSSCQLPDGRRFETFFEFRNLIAADEATLAKGLAGRLLVYGTGGELTFADRLSVNKIIAEASKQDYGFRSILEAVLASEPFLTK